MTKQTILTAVTCLFTANLFAAVLSGPINNPANGHFYYLLTGSSWTNARGSATDIGAYLVVINDAEENAWVYSQFSNYGGVSRRLWIGLTDEATEGTYLWTDGTPLTYSNWTPGQPDNYLNAEDYIFMESPANPYPGTWGDFPVTSPGVYGVAEKTTGNLVHGYKIVTDAEADKYLFSPSLVKKYKESLSTPPAQYWGTSENDVTGKITYKYVFDGQITLAFLHVELASFNFSGGGGSGYGASSAWASKDGVDWTLLLDNPTPSRIDSYKTYDQNLPDALTGGNTLYIQIRLLNHGAPLASYSDAQFSRSDTNRTTNVYEFRATVGPSPTPTATPTPTPTATPTPSPLPTATPDKSAALKAFYKQRISVLSKKLKSVRNIEDKVARKKAVKRILKQIHLLQRLMMNA